jgi:uncharacterized FlaG/YvyC family protein
MDSSIWIRAFAWSAAGFAAGAACGFCAQRIPVQNAAMADKRDRPENVLAEVEIMEVNKVNGAAPPPISVVAEPQANVAPELIQAVKAVNGAKLFGQDTELSFLMDREARRFVVRLVNKDTHKVIRQVPAEEVLRQAEALKKA